DGGHYHHAVGAFGVVDNVHLDVNYTTQRAEYFQNLAEETGNQRNPLGNGSARETAAFTSQSKMANNYSSDMNTLPEAQQVFDLFMPNANMAARSYVKTHEIAEASGYDDDVGPALNAKDKAALSKASVGKEGGVLDEGASLHLAARQMQSARLGMIGASQKLASVVKGEAVEGLTAQLEKANKRKEDINKQIEKARKIGEYIETAGSALAGGAGFIHASLSAGKHEFEPETKPEETDIRPENIKKAHEVGEGIEKGGGIIGSAAAFGVELYHAKELDQIKTKISVVTGMLAEHAAFAAKAAVDEANTVFEKASVDYQTAVETYSAKINDRRKRMAAIGANADKSLGPKEHWNSDAMLYTTTVLETQSFLEVAMESGNAAKKTVDRVLYTQVKPHRSARYGLLEDIYTANNTPRTEMSEAANPDLKALNRMRDLVAWWLEGASNLKHRLDKIGKEQAEPVLAAANYTGKY
ncbi:MAG TPA: hypothetical protein VGC41_24380, partial [Kofleriaceae bacterium]